MLINGIRKYEPFINMILFLGIISSVAAAASTSRKRESDDLENHNAIKRLKPSTNVHIFKGHESEKSDFNLKASDFSEDFLPNEINTVSSNKKILYLIRKIYLYTIFFIHNQFF